MVAMNLRVKDCPAFNPARGEGRVADKTTNVCLGVRNCDTRHSLSSKSVKTRLWAKKPTLF